MATVKKMSLKIGTSIISKFERIDIPMFRIFSEFIDNSLQSYLDHEKELKSAGRSKCVIDITWKKDEIIIKDYAFGMNEEEFGRAIRLNATAASYSPNSLSKYGMGLKYAACNLGSIVSIVSSRYGSREKLSTKLDFEEWLNNIEEQDVYFEEASEKDSFTEITITKLHSHFTEKTLRETILKLSMIYKYFLSDEQNLSISINNEKIEYNEPEVFIDENGYEVSKSISSKFIHSGVEYKYVGYIARLKVGSTDNAGLTIIVNKRGHLLNYRPKLIFKNANSFEYQRLFGEIELEGGQWPLTINKDGFAWKSNGLEEAFLNNLSQLSVVKEIQKLVKKSLKEEPRKIKWLSPHCAVNGIKTEYKLNEKVTFTIVPDDEYTITEVKINNQILEPVSENKMEYSFIIDKDLPLNSVLTIKTNSSKDSCGEVISKGETITVTFPSEQPPIKKEKSQKEIVEKYFSKLKKVKIPGYINEKEPNIYEEGIIIEFENIKYSFLIENACHDVLNDSRYTLKTIDNKYQNSYKIVLDDRCAPFRYLNLGEDFKTAEIIFAISLSLASLISTYSKLSADKSSIFIEKFNKILYNAEKNNEY